MNRISEHRLNVGLVYLNPLNSTKNINQRKLISRKDRRQKTITIQKVNSDVVITMSKSLFSYHYAIGKGGFSKV